jgi:hypothetical protein
MTRKDYVAIAQVLKDANNVWRTEGIQARALTLLCTNFARILADDNPCFDRARFLKACGVAS